MGELLPSIAARAVQSGLLDYLQTTFGLSDEDVRLALAEFLEHPDDGIFKGPYLRLRMPFRPAAEGWRDTLGWHPGDEAKPGAPGSFAPYGHQAEAFARLSSADLGPDKPRPLSTLVTTGTGSGKTEAFLYPILDHVLRAKAQGVTGTKALLLYPMNALANDQAQRLAELITTLPSLEGVTAGLYTGQEGPKRTRVTQDGLITDRYLMRRSPPDILLTNYKMLDQMLLRHADAQIWELSARSLQYLVLDEFHTYDGAQGTDVAMLLRRLGLTLKAHGAEGEDPLAHVTPVATSATLGDKADPAEMVDFAQTVFGGSFDIDSVITESRLEIEEWTADAVATVTSRGLAPETGTDLLNDVLAATRALGPDPEAADLARAVVANLYDGDATGISDADLLRAHPVTHQLLETCVDATELRALAAIVLGSVPVSAEDGAELVSAYAGALSHVRYAEGRELPSVEVHLWVRELTRIDREAVATDPTFWWSDDGTAPLGVDDDERSSGSTFPAIFCRHCGRSGWGVALSPANANVLDTSDTNIRRNHAGKQGRFRPLLLASREGDSALSGGEDEPGATSLRWFDVARRELLAKPPTDEEAQRDGSVIPVLTHVGSDADESARKDHCPACQQRDGIRFLGSAVATQLSVALSTLFGSTNLDQSEKKTLVFTDSVQDAAHRAGFVQSRSHSLTVRSMLRQAIGDAPTSLELLADRVIEQAGDDATLRFRILPPDLADKDEFRPFWQAKRLSRVPQSVRSRVRRRIAFDAVLEFGLQSRLGRTLEMTGSVAAEVVAARGTMLTAARQAVDEAGGQALLPIEAGEATLLAWVRGTLERMRERGSIEHEWLKKLVEEDGNRYFIWRGRPKSQGMPAFPVQRTAPAFPRIGAVSKVKENVLDPVATPQSWYAQWTARSLGVTATEGATLARLLLKRLAANHVLTVTSNKGGAEVFGVPQGSVVVGPIREADLVTGRHLLVCRVCQGQVPGTTTVIDQLDGAPCVVTRCTGRLERTAGDPDNFYRRFFGAKQVQRVIAREHSSLLDDATRLKYEDGFKGRADDPSAPNVLVATPTLEMGIDIGDLSTVMLASLPRTVASYLQRVGRAGRLTGSALDLAFVSGRGEQLPRLGQPTSMINGRVRPPATYVDAEEILRRQFLASLADRQSRANDGVHPELPTGAIGSMDPGSYLHEIALDGERGEDHLEAFLASFSTLSKESRTALRDWVSPQGDTDLTSPMSRRLLAESQRWRQRVETLGHRIAAIEASIPELQRLAELPVASDDDKDAYRSAQASLRLAKRQRAELQTGHWVAVLEEAGILPNYTLLDDSVTLDVGLSWLDPDSGEYETESWSYHRNAALALRELAPGATFYAGGNQIKVSTVDLGHRGEAVRTWVFCPACGYRLDVSEGAVTPTACPRCGSPGVADVAQRLDVVELTRVSSSMRRDEAGIDDSNDERVRERFDLVVTADYAPEDVTTQWYVEGFGFGAKHVRDLSLMWLNIGRSAGHGTTRFIAGNEVEAELFRVCSECGQLDQATGRNSRYEHRPWCSLRDSSDENTVSLALSRNLQTEGLVLRLPPMVSAGNSFAIPSLVAAVKLGLREHIGGAPDHLAMEAVVDPVPAPDAGNVEALLLHDVVPGGTGYLADLCHVDTMYEVLWRAHDVLHTCSCAGVRLSCHLCLLPFAGPGQGELVSRVEAERLLRDILLGGTGEEIEPTRTPGWKVTKESGVDFDPESKLEQKFRAVLKKRLHALGATLKEYPEAKGVRIDISAGGGRRWSLDPQVNVGSSKPDFVLRCDDPNVPPVAIFCDGWQFHASPQHNNLAADARKRAELRDLGYVVLGFAWPDLGDADSEQSAPTWFDDRVPGQLMAQPGNALKPSSVDAIRRGPLDLLISWIQAPDPDGLAAIGRVLPWFFAPVAQTQGHSGQRADLGRTCVDILDGHELAGEGVPVWVWREDTLVVACRLNTKNDATEITVLLDDDADAIGPEHRSAWQAYLRLTNLLALRGTGVQVTTRSLLASTGADSAGVPEPGSDGTLPPLWQTLADDATEAERAVIERLAAAGLMPPKLGEELNGLPLGPSWPSVQVTIDLDLSDDERGTLVDLGWTVLNLEVDVEAIRNALAKEGV